METSKRVPEKIRNFLVRHAAQYPSIERVIVFGSRARGDAHERSDYDLAVVARGMTFSHWSRFALEVDEQMPTLCGVDLILLNDHVAPPLRERIESEGVILYERAA